MSNQEPIDTTLPWARPRNEPIDQVEAERRAYRAMTEPGNGKIHKMSLTTPTYEPNRAMAPDPQSLIGKKGMKPKKEDTYAPVTFGDRIVYGVIAFCAVMIIGVIVALFIKLG